MAKTSKNSTDKVNRERLRAYRERQAVHEAQSRRRRRDNFLWLTVGIVVVALAVAAQVLFVNIKPYTANPSGSPSAAATSAEDALVPDPTIAQDRTWQGVLDINGIPLTLELDGAKAPQAVSNTIALTEKYFYDQLSCHRLTTKGIYVLQCGDPNGDGTGGPGYSFGPIENAPADNMYPAGTIAMARQGGNSHSMGSQFFIVYRDSMIPADKVGGYTIIGHITGGLDQLMTDVINRGTLDGSDDGKPVVDTAITSFTLQ